MRHVYAEEDTASGEEGHQVPVHGDLPVSGGGVYQGQVVSSPHSPATCPSWWPNLSEQECVYCEQYVGHHYFVRTLS